jgi:purine-binding chemotaxis protein CheW
MPPMTESLRALFVTSGEHLCALPLEHVLEVMRPQPVGFMQSGFRFVEGTAMIRGEPTPVLNLGRLLGDAEGSPAERLVTLKVGARSVAIAVSSIRSVRTLDARSFVDLPPLLRDSGSEYIERLGRLDAELVLVLSAARLVPDAFWAELDRAGDAG